MELKMTADNERIRREQRASLRSLSLQSRRSLYASVPAMKSDGAIFVAGRDIRYYVFDGDSLGY
jgi:Tfp pilus assembly protein PilZ